jgi:hypothetical protein
MSDEVENEVVVSAPDVQKMRDALKTAYWKAVVEDMNQAYRALDTDGSRSRSALTGQLEDALQTAEAAMKLADDATPEPQDDKDSS